VVCQLAVDVGAAVLVEVRLGPFSVSVVNSRRELRVVEIKKVRTEADDRTVFLMELLDTWGIVGRDGLTKTPDICPSYERFVSMSKWSI
jgi:hypothetical protein